MRISDWSSDVCSSDRISAASTEQSQGVAQVGEAVTNMDQATQQNAALVEQMAAAASRLKGQSEELVQTVAVFKLADDGSSDPAAYAQDQSHGRKIGRAHV